MNNMPNDDAPPCGCKWFENAVRDPEIPVVFDELMKEYHLVTHGGGGHALFYHCPFCGGRAPRSLRGTFFAKIPDKETYRLHSLTKKFKTEEEVISTFGPPDHEFEIGSGMTTPGSDTEPREHFLNGRRLVYKGLSDTADVNVRIDRYGKLKFSFSEKYIGPQRETEQGAAANP